MITVINQLFHYKNDIKMKNRYKGLGLMAALLVTVLFHSCDDVEPIIEEIQYERAFTPLELTVQVRNQMTAEVNWKTTTDTEYTLEISNDNLEFGTIVHTETVMDSELPYSILLESEEQYSVRVKANSNVAGQNDSKWSALAFETEAENIFYPLADSNKGKTDVDTWVILTWPAESAVTHLIINPGDNQIRRDLTADEIAVGEATLDGLPFDTQFIIKMFNGTNPKQRGNVTFTTLPEGETLTPADNLSEKIANAKSGDVFLLEGGVYTAFQGQITIDKAIKLQGLSSDDMPVLNVQFVLTDGAESAKFINLNMNGSYTDETEAAVILDHAFNFNSATTAVGDVFIQGCKISNYNKSFISGASGVFTVNSIEVNNCIVTDIFGNGGDFIDFRTSFPASIIVTNSTFANCATVSNRDLFRLDGAGKGNTFDDGAHTPVISVIANTFYQVQNNASGGKNFFYVRWQNSAEVMTVERNLIVDATSQYSSSSDTNFPSFNKNNYFNAAKLLDAAMKVYDNSGTHTSVDPGFADAVSGDFTLSNQTLIDTQVGDPRWR
jgi:hypothetical protein